LACPRADAEVGPRKQQNPHTGCSNAVHQAAYPVLACDNRGNTRKPFSFPNHPELFNKLNPQPRGKHFWGTPDYLSIAEDAKISRMIILAQMTFSVMLASGHGIIPHRQVRRGKQKSWTTFGSYWQF
jgi:hypothetical protein